MKCHDLQLPLAFLPKAYQLFVLPAELPCGGTRVPGPDKLERGKYNVKYLIAQSANSCRQQIVQSHYSGQHVYRQRIASDDSATGLQCSQSAPGILTERPAADVSAA